MTPLEELQAAHKRLNELRDRTSPGPWFAGYCDPGEGLFDLDAEAVGTVAELFREQDLYLIVTLHRTIDAQLLILDRSIGWAKGTAAMFGASKDVDPDALALARAINGEAS